MHGVSAEMVKARRERPSTLGVRLSAVGETLAFLALALAAGYLLDIPERFAGLAVHPFWLIVILIASSYGTAEGVMAACLASAALLAGNVPEQAFAEPLAHWLLRITTLPVGWIIVAIILGEIRSSHMHSHDELLERYRRLEARAARIAGAYEKVQTANLHLEHRAASRRQTLHAHYEAAGRIDRPSVGEVLQGAPDFVRAILEPLRFSIFELGVEGFEARSMEGWEKDGRLLACFSLQTPIFEAVALRKEQLCVTDEAQEAILDRQGVLAGPLLDVASGRVFGMLKIEEAGPEGLTAASLIDFRVACMWIGRACAAALAQDAWAPDSGWGFQRPGLPANVNVLTAQDFTAVLTSASSPLAEAAMRLLLGEFEEEDDEDSRGPAATRPRRHVVN